MAGDDESRGKRRLAGLLAKRFFVRFHLSLILGFSFAVGLVRSTRCITDPGWMGGAVHASWLPLLGILALALLLATLVSRFVPQAHTLLEAVRLLLAAA